MRPNGETDLPVGPLALALLLASLALVLFELVLTRIFAIVMFAQFAHLAISLALLGIGVGALALHLFPRLVPPDRLLARFGWLSLAMAGAMVVAVVLAVRLPFTRASDVLGDARVVQFGERQARALSLVAPWTLVLLAPAIALPFACGGVAFAAAFRDARGAIGRLYAADLCGGAAGCLAFLPALSVLRGPDAVVLAVLAASGAAAAAFASLRSGRSVRGRRGLWLASATGLVALAAAALGLSTPLFPIRHAAGFDERLIVYERWTPLTRLGVFEDPNGRTFVVLDSTSRSEVVRTAERLKAYEAGAVAVVFKLHRPGRVAILAAGAGADVMAARHEGHRDVTAIEIASEIFDIVRTRYASDPDNPFRQKGVRTIKADARSAILRDPGKFDIIEMAQPNLYSYGGVLSQAWSPELLYTREAFGDYLDHLTRDGTISFTWRSAAYRWARAAAHALRARGATSPWRHIALVKSRQAQALSILVKARPWAQSETRRLRQIVRADRHQLVLDPERGNRAWRQRLLGTGPVLTDDHPYADDLSAVGGAAATLAPGWRAQGVPGAVLLMRVLLIQLAIIVVAGALLFGVPILLRGRRAVSRVEGAGPLLGYFAAIGYGYLAVEIVLIHKLVLFVGHPTYAVTVVLFVLLVSSGVGSLVAGRVPAASIGRLLPMALFAVLFLAALQAFAVGPLLTRRLLGLGFAFRVIATGATLFPLGFAMGMAFPLALRQLPSAGDEVVPWCWAINGWTSVLASALTVLVSRLGGYALAFSLALLAYALAIPLSLRLGRLRLRDPYDSQRAA